MFFALSKTLDWLVVPLSWVVLLVLASFPWRLRGWHHRRRLRGGCAVVALLVLVVFGNEWVADRLSHALEDEARSTYDSAATYDVVVLMGGVGEAAAPDGRFSYNENVERLLATYDLLRQGKARTAIVSGAWLDPRRPDVTEAASVVEQLAQWGIARDRLVAEPKALNTRDNAVYVAELVRARGDKKILVITSAFHVPRSLACFAAVSLPVDVLPVDYRASPTLTLGTSSPLPRAAFLARSSQAVRELVGRAIYRVVGFGGA